MIPTSKKTLPLMTATNRVPAPFRRNAMWVSERSGSAHPPIPIHPAPYRSGSRRVVAAREPEYLNPKLVSRLPSTVRGHPSRRRSLDRTEGFGFIGSSATNTVWSGMEWITPLMTPKSVRRGALRQRSDEAHRKKRPRQPGRRDAYRDASSKSPRKPF